MNRMVIGRIMTRMVLGRGGGGLPTVMRVVLGQARPVNPAWLVRGRY